MEVETVPQMQRLVILAPNWLGDAVMALPAIADVRRQLPRASIAIAARRSVAALFRIVADVNEVIELEARLARWRDAGGELRGRRFEAALLMPNSFQSAFAAARAAIPERWGYRTDWRRPLLTRAVPPAKEAHQIDYYRGLVRALGFTNGPAEPTLRVPDAARASGAEALARAGWDGRAPLVGLAPGAAYGGAKRWPPEHFAELASALAHDGVVSVMVGSAADRQTGMEIEAAFGPSTRSGQGGLLNLIAATDLVTLAGVLSHCRTLVSNDSGAMHLGAAVGVPVTAVFGPTNDLGTRPRGEAHAILTNPVWCRPCMLRECPLDHRCMRDIGASAVLSAARRTL